MYAQWFPIRITVILIKRNFNLRQCIPIYALWKILNERQWQNHNLTQKLHELTGKKVTCHVNKIKKKNGKGEKKAIVLICLVPIGYTCRGIPVVMTLTAFIKKGPEWYYNGICTGSISELQGGSSSWIHF